MEENDKLVQFIFNHNREVVAEKDESIWRSYIRERELLFSSAEHARTYYHYASDEMGSITHITDGDKVLNAYEYDAWGNVVSNREEVRNRFKFNGQQLDGITGQYYLRARFYNPVITRFTQEDTYRGDGLNLYACCRNNPVYYVDPTGNACEGLEQLQGAKNNGEDLVNQDIKSEDTALNIDTDRKNIESIPQTLYHYTNEKGMNGILESNELRPPLKANNPKDARYGNGQYLSDIIPETTKPMFLASRFIRVPNEYKYTHFVEVDIKGLNVIKGRDEVYVILNEDIFDIPGRIVRSGKVGK